MLGVYSVKIKHKYLYAIYAGFFILGQFPFLIEKTIDLVSELIRLYGYGKYINLMHSDSSYAFARNPFGVISVLVLLLHLALIYLYPKLKQHFSGDKFFLLSFRFAFVYACYFTLTINTSRYIKRPGELLMLFLMIVTGYALSYLFSTKRMKALVCMILISCSTVYISLAKDYIGHNGDPAAIKYHFIPSLNYFKK